MNLNHLEYWIKQKKKQDLIVQERLETARNEVNSIVQVLVSQFEVKKVILFGSLVRGKFHENSDIDLAVEGIKKEDFFRVLAIANRLTDRWVDLKPLEDLEPHFHQRVLATGECLYEANIT